jgi:hypothetical protein
MRKILEALAATALVVAFVTPVWAVLVYDFAKPNDKIIWLSCILTLEAVILAIGVLALVGHMEDQVEREHRRIRDREHSLWMAKAYTRDPLPSVVEEVEES